MNKSLFFLFFLFSFLSQALSLSIESMTYPKANSLHEAVFFGDIERVKKLIKKGTDVNDTSGERGISVSSVASFSFTGSKQIKNLTTINERRARLKNTLLTDWLKNINDNNQSQKANKGTTALHWIRNDNVEIAKLLIENEADVNAKTKEYFKTKFGKTTSSHTISIPDQSTPLDLAILNEHIKTAKLLIDNGADINAKDNYGNTPLHKTNNIEIAKTLIHNGADVNARNTYGNTPLYKIEDIETIKLLVDNGADVNTKNKQGNTPLHYAGNRKTAKVLVDNGADVNAINNKGQTVCDTVRHDESRMFFIKGQGGCSFLVVLPKRLWQKIKTLFKRK